MTGPQSPGDARRPAHGGVDPHARFSGAPRPLGAKLILLVGLAVVVWIALITFLYDRGWLPIAGPFVALALAPFIAAVALPRRRRRLADRAVEDLRSLAPRLAEERALPADRRTTGASDQSLAAATEQVDQALRRFAWGQDLAAVADVDRLAQTAGDSWAGDSTLATDVSRLAATTRKLDRLLRRFVRDQPAR